MSSHNNTPTFTTKEFSWKSGKQWFDSGVNLFKVVKRPWYMTCIMLGMLLVLVGNVSAELVTILMVFASPMVTAFMMKCCQQATVTPTLQFGRLWQPVMENFNALFILGVISAGLSLLFNYLHMQILLANGLPVVLTEELVKNMSGKESLFRACLNLLTNLPVVLALAFSPALIIFKQTKPLTAIKFSALGVIRSWRAFVALTLIFLLLFFAIVMAASLMISVVVSIMGAASPVVINVIILFFLVTAGGIGLGAQYQAYADIYMTDVNQDEDPGEDDGTEVYAEI